MYETHMTVVGNLATGVTERRFADGTPVANFRVASTERRYDRASGGWGDGDSLYVEVTCRRQLAENAAASLVKGDPVVVTGRLFTRDYEHQGQRRSTMTLEAQSIGADLSWCTAVVSRTRRRPGGQTGGSGSGTEQGGPAESASAASADAARAPDDAPRLVGAAPGGEG